MNPKVAIAAFLMILCSEALSSATCNTLSQPRLSNTSSSALLISPAETSHEGNLYINGSETLILHDREFNVTGTIFMQDHSTLDVENTTLTLKLPFDSSATDFITATDEASILLSNSTIMVHKYSGPPYWSAITGHNQTQISISGSTIEGYQVSISLFDASTITMKNSKMTGESNLLETLGNSSSNVENSAFKRFDLQDNSTASVTNSTIDEISVGNVPGQTALNITSSSITDVGTWGEGSCHYIIKNSTIFWLDVSPNSSAYITRTSGNQLSTHENTTVLLSGSSWNQIDLGGNAVVLVRDWFFGLPLTGFVGVHYTWILPMQIFIVVSAIVAIGVSVLVIRAKRLKREKAEMDWLMR
jgi:hypothetical protein